MATIIKHFLILFNEYVEETVDPRGLNYPCMSSPLWLIGIIGFYLFTVNKWGPQLMKNRKPFELRNLMIVYNIVQIIANASLFIGGIRFIFFKLSYSLICEPIDSSDNPDALWIVNVAWFYFVIKVVDLFDTVVMILRKKDNQISFLHVYHHSGMILASWIATRYLPGGHTVLIGLINCFVHAIMYSYYLITVIYPEYKKSLWWKKHLTELQMVQFIYMAFHCAVSVFNPYCTYNKPLLLIFMIQNGFIFAMFLEFYIRAYIKPNKDKKKQEVKDD